MRSRAGAAIYSAAYIMPSGGKQYERKQPVPPSALGENDRGRSTEEACRHANDARGVSVLEILPDAWRLSRLPVW